MATLKELANEMAKVKENIDNWNLNRQQLIDEALKHYGITDEAILLNTRGTFGKTKGKVVDSLFARYLKEKGIPDPSIDFPKTSVNIGNTELALDPKTGKWELNVDELNIMEKNKDAQKWYARIKNQDGILGKQYKGRAFKDLNSGNKINVAKAYVEQRVLPSLPLDTPVTIKGGRISSQSLSEGGEITKASGDAKTKRYKEWWIDKPTTGFTEESGQIIFRNTGQPINPKNPGPRTKAGYPPTEVRQEWIKDYKARKTAAGGATIQANYRWEGTDFTLYTKKGAKGGMAVKPLPLAAKNEALRDGVKINRSIIEDMMTENVFQQQNRLNSLSQFGGIEFEHKWPRAKGGPIDHPAYTGLASADLNKWKGDRPRDIPYIPFGVETIEDMESLGYIIEDGKWKSGYPIDEMLSKQQAFKKTAQSIDRGIGNRSVGAAGFGAELAPSSGAGWDLAKVGRRAGTLLPFVGAGLDAWDVQQRYQEMMNNPNEGVADWLDKAQFGIASATVGTSFWAEPANFALGIANLGIDAMRTIFEEEKREDFGHMMRGVTRNIGHTAQKLF